MIKIKLPKLMKLNSVTYEEPAHTIGYKIFKGSFEEMLASQAKIESNKKPTHSENQIDPELFASRMEVHWTDELGNIGSDALRATWRQIAEYFNALIRNHDTDDSRKWYALSPPTGSGKTEGTIIYCSMLAKLKNYEHPGVMIVTRRIEDAEKIAQRINQFGGRETAIAFHSGEMIKEVKINDLPTYPVLVICHEAYKKAVGLLDLNMDALNGRWPLFSNYIIGQRKLTVIDECIDLVEDASATLDGLRKTLGSIPEWIRINNPQAIEDIKYLIQVIKVVHGLLSKEYNSLPDIMAPTKSFRWIDFGSLIRALHLENLDPSREHEERLNNAAQIYRDWSYYSKQGKEHTLKSARMLIPKEGIRGAVIMDATASANKVYGLFKEVEMVNPPKGSRNYRNFTLYISKGHRVGKDAMKSIGHKQIPELMGRLNSELKGKDVLVITHLIGEPHVEGCRDSVDFKFKAAHWQNLDGSNDWKDCQAVVLASLPYLPDTWGNNRYMAFKGPRYDDWLQSEEGILQRRVLRSGKLASDIVQALNRVQSRKVINHEGDCPETVGYMLMGRNKEENDVLINHIKRMMPGINIKTFEFQKQQKTLKTNKELILIKFLENVTPGEHQRTTIESETKISRATLTRLIKRCRESGSNLNNELEKLNVSVETRRQGRSSKAFFVKRHST